VLPSQSALAVLVPEAEPLVRTFRDKYDPSAAAGMSAHITVLYPFKPPDEIGDNVLDKIRQCLTGLPIFDFSLAAIRRFAGGVLYLAPQPDELFRRLTSAIWNCFPETPPYEGKYSKIVPHLTVAQPGDEEQLHKIATNFERTAGHKLPIPAMAREIVLMDMRTGVGKSALYSHCADLRGASPLLRREAVLPDQ